MGQLYEKLVGLNLLITIAMGNNQIANGICPSPSGEVRWGLDGSIQSNNFYLKTKTKINPRRMKLLFPHGSELRIENNFPAQPVYLCLSLVCFCEVVT